MLHLWRTSTYFYWQMRPSLLLGSIRDQFVELYTMEIKPHSKFIFIRLRLTSSPLLRVILPSLRGITVVKHHFMRMLYSQTVKISVHNINSNVRLASPHFQNHAIIKKNQLWGLSWFEQNITREEKHRVEPCLDWGRKIISNEATPHQGRRWMGIIWQ